VSEAAGFPAASLISHAYELNDQSWQLLLIHIHICATAPFAVPQFWSSSTMPLFSTTS
jgi:hypothetical protein